MKFRGRKYYHDNRNRQLSLALIRRHRAYKIKRELINKYKDHPCSDCGKKYPPYVMDFDHRNRNDKIEGIGHLSSRNWSIEKIKKEIEKCDLVCSNCHRIRTYSKIQNISKTNAELAKVVTAHL